MPPRGPERSERAVPLPESAPERRPGAGDAPYTPPGAPKPRPAGRWWARLGLVAVVLVAAGLRLWRLDQNGHGNAYYAAGVRSMMGSWHNFLYNSFDPAGFVSVDKPPVALWVQVASAKLFGYGGLSLLVPQVVEGVAAVLLLAHLVGRRFGAGAGLLAGLFLALTPINVAVDRTNLTDSCLVLVLLLSAWALTRAAEKGSWPLLLLSVALVGVGFNVKMLAACVVLPTFYAVYFLAAPVAWRSRLGDLALASLVLAVVALSWSVAFDLTPPEERPFAGSTQENSMLELAVGHNGVRRFARRGRFPGAQGPRPNFAFRGAAPPFAGDGPPPGTPPPFGGPPGAGPRFPGGRGGPPGFGGRAPVGPLRLADPHLAAQVGWLFPLAVMGLVVGAFRSRLNWTLGPAHLALLLWFGWALTYGVVYSWAGGIFHEYYLNTLGPPLAALAGIGVAGLWSCSRRGGWRTLLLPVALLLTAGWQVYIQREYLGWEVTPDLVRSPGAFVDAVQAHAGWPTWLMLGLVSGTALAALGLLVPRLRASWARLANVVTPAALAVGLLALLATPTAWALSNVLVRGNALIPVADLRMLTRGTAEAGPPRFRGRFAGPPGGSPGFGRPGGFGGFGALREDPKLLAFLRANHHGERFLLATTSTQQAAPIIIQTGEAVMALGGFMGSDPILTPERFAELVEDGEVRFVMAGGPGFRGGRRRFGPPGPAGGAGPQAVLEWVRKNGKAVDPALWRASAPDAGEGPAPGRRSPGGRNGPFGGRVGGQLYDLRPRDGYVPAPAE